MGDYKCGFIADCPPPALRATPASGGYLLPIAGYPLPVADCRLSTPGASRHPRQRGILVAACWLPIGDCRLPIADCPSPALRATPASGGHLLPLAGCPLPIAYCPLPIAYCLLPSPISFPTFTNASMALSRCSCS